MVCDQWFKEYFCGREQLSSILLQVVRIGRAVTDFNCCCLILLGSSGLLWVYHHTDFHVSSSVSHCTVSEHLPHTDQKATLHNTNLAPVTVYNASQQIPSVATYAFVFANIAIFGSSTHTPHVSVTLSTFAPSCTPSLRSIAKGSSMTRS